ncbi:MAG TPA: integrin alpha, partial [Planctomycetota bacterium]|nr:integrin alpha [Planctomycetota bacterium]
MRLLPHLVAALLAGSASSQSVLHDASLTSTAAGDHFGGAVAGAGDVNDDGYADVIVGVQVPGVAGTGLVRVFSGKDG